MAELKTVAKEYKGKVSVHFIAKRRGGGGGGGGGDLLAAGRDAPWLALLIRVRLPHGPC